MYVLIKSIYTISFCLIKISYTERKQVQKNFFTKSSSITVTLKTCLFEIQGQILWLSYTAEIHLFEILRQILWLLYQRYISLNVWKLYSAIFDYKVKFLNKKLCSLNCCRLKEAFWQYVTIHGLDEYNTMFQNAKRVLHQNKAQTKIS